MIIRSHHTYKVKTHYHFTSEAQLNIKGGLKLDKCEKKSVFVAALEKLHGNLGCEISIKVQIFQSQKDS